MLGATGKNRNLGWGVFFEIIVYEITAHISFLSLNIIRN